MEQELSRHVGEKGSTHHRIQRVVGSRHPCGASGGKAEAAALGPPKWQSAWERRASPSLDPGGLFLVSSENENLCGMSWERTLHWRETRFLPRT